MLKVVSSGIQTTLQGKYRVGFRHLGVPYSGPADPLSMAIANRLVGNSSFATSLEITFGGFVADVETPCTIAVTGAGGDVLINDENKPHHETLQLNAGDRLDVPQATTGMRIYLSIHGGFTADTLFGSTSTYLPAGFGGLGGRAVNAGDVLEASARGQFDQTLSSPTDLVQVFSNSFALRTCESAETKLLTQDSLERLFQRPFIAGRQATRMGLSLESEPLRLNSDGLMKSTAVFPGTIQCPQSGTPIALLCDAQTTGGYPRVAHIARCDRHLLGQVRPGDKIQLLHRSHDAAARELEEKTNLLRSWIMETVL